MSKAHFSQLMDDLGLIYDKEVSTSLKRLYWEDLGHLPIDMIELAMTAHRRDPVHGRFFPKPAELLGQLQRAHPDGRLSADEAWALMISSFDERETVCLTDEMLEAAKDSAKVWAEGDKIGARMAFKGAYERITASRRAQGQLPVWQMSLGWDTAKRAQVAQEALRLGRLPLEKVKDYLPAPAPQGPAALVAGLLSGNVVEFPVSADEKTRRRLAELREVISRAGQSRPERDPVAEREAFNARKREAAEALAKMQAQREEAGAA